MGGISMMANICTLWITPTPLTPFASPPIATGCALPLAHLSRFGILKARTWLKSSNPKSQETLLRLDLPNACLWLGLLMVKLCLLVTLITKFAPGRCLSPPLVKKKKGSFWHFCIIFDGVPEVASPSCPSPCTLRHGIHGLLDRCVGLWT